jgi:hypothetical protein
MLLEKKPLSFVDIEAQTALELPNREMMLVTIVISDSINPDVEIEVKNNNIAVQVCAAVVALSSQLGLGLTCDIAGNQ